ncbi:tautomerase family protein [Leptothrix discophora]|uniref:4-oxalocrotonate tautomerase n=1 Tax=Leptothrix discophora TaxID=89 RepID=A0ABT9FZB5_LEPDI|nr:4-oxalocrotonate tautomerase [Leptothrix discophora]MDP4299387.1 4-oxalocrotonate tautomerase [Leptothrix discophora]
MPILTVLIGTLPSPQLARDVAEDLLELTEKVLDKRRDLTSIALQFVPPAQWFIGGDSVQTLDRPTAFVEIRITDETNTKAQKARYVALVHEVLRARLGQLHPVSYVQISDVRGAAWGWGGRTQEARAHRPEG